MKKSIVREKSKVFALCIINLYKYLTTNKKEYIISKQLLRSGTSIGANVNEALCSISKKNIFQKCIYHTKKHRKVSIGWIYLKNPTT